MKNLLVPSSAGKFLSEAYYDSLYLFNILSNKEK